MQTYHLVSKLPVGHLSCYFEVQECTPSRCSDAMQHNARGHQRHFVVWFETMAFRKRKYLLERVYEALQRDCCMTLIPISTHSQRVRLWTFDVLIPRLGVHTKPWTIQALADTSDAYLREAGHLEKLTRHPRWSGGDLTLTRKARLRRPLQVIGNRKWPISQFRSPLTSRLAPR